LANKKALFMNISQYYKAMGLDPFEVAIPLTFHIKSANDPEYTRFERVFQSNQSSRKNQNVWIIKPGENTNRGQGIQVASSLNEIKSIIRSFNGDRTSIV
jgi:tubulin---tyrosine ligase